MQKVKIFVGDHDESSREIDQLDYKINTWLKESGATIISMDTCSQKRGTGSTHIVVTILYKEK